MQPLIRLSLFRSPPSLNFSRVSKRFMANMNGPSAAEADTQAEAVASTSGITPASLQKTLMEKLSAKHVDVEDMSGS